MGLLITKTIFCVILRKVTRRARHWNCFRWYKYGGKFKS